MIEKGRGGGSDGCIGYAQFLDKMSKRSFAVWFDRLHEDLESRARSPMVGDDRLDKLRRQMVDLVTILDPKSSLFWHHLPDDMGRPVEMDLIQFFAEFGNDKS